MISHVGQVTAPSPAPAGLQAGSVQAKLTKVESTVWTEAVAALPGTAVFKPAAPESSLVHCATTLGHPLPADLVALLRESDGIEGEYGDGLIWSAERIASENQGLREDAELASLYMPFDALLFFADEGNGDLFGLLSRIDRPDVFVWNHEDDSRIWVAPTLAKYLEWRLAGQIKL
ncbi:SMI1/KNR4 family protein [Streptomyces viridochromogenes]|uniref:SMI1/KNR4 family protein n=1 Tax=Streptomyces viridochromogenes TaxID=1938 RepID=UPI001FCC99FA|nr:SMI1/KNR4 family protein [Streptomyces viridochromogenes]